MIGLFSISGVLFFYFLIFLKRTKKLSILISAVALFIIAIVNEIISSYLFFYFIFCIALIPAEWLKPLGMIFFRTLKPAFGGVCEEFFRSVFVVLYAKIRREKARRNEKIDYSHINVIDGQIYGLAFLYGIIESGRMVLQVYPGIMNMIKDRSFEVDIFATSQLADTSILYSIAFAIALVLRYYIHLYFLKWSVYSLAAGRKWLYVLSLFFHFSAGMALGYFSSGSVEYVIIAILAIEVVFVSIMAFLFSKVNLREQIIARNATPNP